MRHKAHPDYADGDNHELVLPDSPWTYESGSVNPSLEPSNAYRRASKARTRTEAKSSRHTNIAHTTGFASSVPPYHPDYNADGDVGRQGYASHSSDDEDSDLDSDEFRYNGGGAVMRVGEEGYEVQEVDREEILRRYIMSRGQEAGHYRRYVPETDDRHSDDMVVGA